MLTGYFAAWLIAFGFSNRGRRGNGNKPKVRYLEHRELQTAI